MDKERSDSTTRERIPARLTLFGAPSTEATLDVTPRPAQQRTTRALVTGGAALLLAPVAAIIPPHFPWALGVLGLGAWRARAEWRGEYELHAFEGACPRCGQPLKLEEKYVTPPLPVHCQGCNAQPIVEVR